MKRRYFRGDAASAGPEVYELLMTEGYKIRHPTVGQSGIVRSIAWPPKRPVSCPAHEVRRHHAGFCYGAGSWTTPRRVVAKVEWHPGELYPRVGLIVTNMTRRAQRVVAFYNQRGTAEQWIKRGKNAVAWTRLSCHRLAASAVRLQLHGACTFLYTLSLPKEVRPWSLTTLRGRLVKIGARIVRHGRSVILQMVEIAVPRGLFRQVLSAISALRPSPPAPC